VVEFPKGTRVVDFSDPTGVIHQTTVGSPGESIDMRRGADGRFVPVGGAGLRGRGAPARGEAAGGAATRAEGLP